MATLLPIRIVSALLRILVLSLLLDGIGWGWRGHVGRLRRDAGRTLLPLLLRLIWLLRRRAFNRRRGSYVLPTPCCVLPGSHGD